MTAIALLRGSDDSLQPFFDPDLLRSMLTDALGEEPEDELQDALKIVDGMERMLSDYRQSVDASMDEYIEQFASRNVSAESLVEILEPMDRRRTETLLKLVEYRQALLNLLSDEQWAETFS